MLQKLRHFLYSLPVLTAAGLFALYLGVGFWGLPALLKSQSEKLVHVKLGQNLAMAHVRVNPLLFTLQVSDLTLSDEQGQPMLGVQRLLVDFELWRSLVDQTWTFASASVQAPNLRLELQQNGRHNFSAMLDKLSGAEAEPLNAAPWPRVVIQQLAVTDAQIDVSDQLLAEPLMTRIAPLTLAVNGLSTVATQTASYRLSASTAQGELLSSDGRLSLSPVAIQGQLALKEIQVRTLARALSRHLTIDAPGGQFSANVRFDLAVDAQNQLAGTLQDVELGVTDLSLQLGQPSLMPAGVALERPGKLLTVSALQFKARQLAMDMPGARPSTSPDRPAQANPFQVSLNDTALRLDALSIRALGATSDLGHVAQVNLAATSLLLALPDGPVELTGQGLSGEMTRAVINSPTDGAEVVQLGRATLVGGTLHLHQQQFTADTLALAQGHVTTWLDEQGQLNLLSLYGQATQPSAVAAASLTPAPPTVKALATAAPWRITVKQTQLDEFALAFEDRRELPALSLRLDPIRARITALDTGSTTPMQLELQTALASGGKIRVDGTVHVVTGASDLQIGLTDIALAPVQRYLSKFAALQLTSGIASSSGRLRYGDPQGAGAQWVFQGQAAVKQFMLEQIAPKRPFLNWAAVNANDLLLTLTPNRLDITELRVVKPTARLIIAADQSVNLTDVLKKTQPVTPPAPVKAPAPVAGGVTTTTPFPVSIARVRVADGTLEFSDASLRPQFAASMHELKGVITGLSNEPDRVAKVQLDARVDPYGSARIGGQISLLSPEKLTEIDMAFSNLDLISLSPYIVKFAGYRIDGGRLWLDLQYRVKDRKLLGENKVVLKQVKLGEKVESPNALNLPLELAIAILTDSDGVIDIGLPVSGDLNDPQFDYGAVIGKAIGNLLGGIVTAPFRALAALFGGGDKPLDTLVFEPGTATLAPPERQKLAAIARALKERPTLKLVVPPTYAEAVDTPALKSLAVRRNIVSAMGITLAPGEDPGPVDVANARTQKAVEAVFNARYAPEVLDALKARALSVAPSAPPSQPPPAFYQSLLNRLVTEQPVSNEALAELATQRSDAVIRELTQTGGVSAARASAGQVKETGIADSQAVTMQLALEVAK